MKGILNFLQPLRILHTSGIDSPPFKTILGQNANIIPLDLNVDISQKMICGIETKSGLAISLCKADSSGRPSQKYDNLLLNTHANQVSSTSGVLRQMPYV